MSHPIFSPLLVRSFEHHTFEHLDLRDSQSVFDHAQILSEIFKAQHAYLFACSLAQFFTDTPDAVLLFSLPPHTLTSHLVGNLFQYAPQIFHLDDRSCARFHTLARRDPKWRSTRLEDDEPFMPNPSGHLNSATPNAHTISPSLHDCFLQPGVEYMHLTRQRLPEFLDIDPSNRTDPILRDLLVPSFFSHWIQGHGSATPFPSILQQICGQKSEIVLNQHSMPFVCSQLHKRYSLVIRGIDFSKIPSHMEHLKLLDASGLTPSNSSKSVRSAL
jgi:hypothetical protein